MTVREFSVLLTARLDLQMEAWGRLGWVVWKLRAMFRTQPETHDAVMGDQWSVWRMARMAREAAKEERSSR